MRPIIIEGPDGIGKTTLIGAMQQRLESLAIESETRHLHKNDVVGFQTVSALLKHLGAKLNPANTNVIWDRFHLGPIVYGWMCELHQNPFKSRHEVSFYVQSALRWNAFTVVMFSSDREWYADHVSTLAARRDELFNVDQMIGANRAYTELAIDDRDYANLYFDVGPGKFNGTDLDAHVLSDAGWI